MIENEMQRIYNEKKKLFENISILQQFIFRRKSKKENQLRRITCFPCFAVDMLISNRIFVFFHSFFFTNSQIY